MTTITIPKNLTSKKNLIAIPFEEYERLLSASLPKKEVVLTLAQKSRLQSARRNLKGGKLGGVTEEDILQWSLESKNLKKTGKLPMLRSLKDFR